MQMMLVTERAVSDTAVMTGRKRPSDDTTEDITDGMTEWRVLESGVLAVKTPLEVASVKTGSRRAIWFDPLKKRLVCSHGWGQYHLSLWNSPRAAAFQRAAGAAAVRVSVCGLLCGVRPPLKTK